MTSYYQRIPPTYSSDFTTDLQNGASFTNARIISQSCLPSHDRLSISNRFSISNCSNDFRNPIYYILTLSPRTIDTILDGPYVPSAARDSYESFLKQKHLMINNTSFVTRPNIGITDSQPVCYYSWCSIVPDPTLPLIHSNSNHFYSSYILSQPNPIPLAYTYFIGYRSSFEPPNSSPFMSLIRTYYNLPDSPFKDVIDDALVRNVDLRHWFDSDFLPIFLANYDPPTNPTAIPEYSYYFDRPYRRASNEPINPYIALPHFAFTTNYNITLYPNDPTKNHADYSASSILGFPNNIWGLKFRHETFPSGKYQLPMIDLFRPIPLAYDDDRNAALLIPVA